MIFQCDLKPLSERRKCVFRAPNFQNFPGGHAPVSSGAPLGGAHVKSQMLVSYGQILRQIRP